MGRLPHQHRLEQPRRDGQAECRGVREADGGPAVCQPPQPRPGPQAGSRHRAQGDPARPACERGERRRPRHRPDRDHRQHVRGAQDHGGGRGGFQAHPSSAYDTDDAKRFPEAQRQNMVGAQGQMDSRQRVGEPQSGQHSPPSQRPQNEGDSEGSCSREHTARLAAGGPRRVGQSLAVRRGHHHGHRGRGDAHHEEQHPAAGHSRPEDACKIHGHTCIVKATLHSSQTDAMMQPHAQSRSIRSPRRRPRSCRRSLLDERVTQPRGGVR